MFRVVFCCLLSLHYQNASCDNQAVSPPPSFFEWLQPFRPIVVVSKFPPIIEFIAQRIQTQFSNYIHEDLSRPQTYDRPTYKPYVPPSTTRSSQSLENGAEENLTSTTTENFIIPTAAPPKVVLVDQYELTSTTRFNQSIQIEYQIRNVIKLTDKHNPNKTKTENQLIANTNKLKLEQTVHLIMQHNDLKENFTHLFEKYDNELKSSSLQDGAGLLMYHEVTTSLFANDDESDDEMDETDEIGDYVMRNDRVKINNKVKADKNNRIYKNRTFIALTKIGKHVYVNVIHLKSIKYV